MENVSYEVKKYTHYFLPNGDYKHFDNLSPILRDKTTLYFSKVLKKIEEDSDYKKYLNVLYECSYFGTSFNLCQSDLSSKLMVDISFRHIPYLEKNFKKNNVSKAKSSHDSVVTMINWLTEILFTNDKKHRDIDSIWMIFLQNLHPQIIKLIEKENSIVFLLLPDTKNEWGWIELQVNSFATCFFDFLEYILTVNSQDLIKPMCFEEIEQFYEYLSSIIKNLKKIFGGEIELPNYFVSFLRSKYYKLIEVHEIFKQTQQLQEASTFVDDTTISESQNICAKKPSPTDDEHQIVPLTNDDFIDLIIGKNRKSKEVKFDRLMRKFPEGSIIFEDKKYKWNKEFFIKTYGVGKPQNYLYAFYGICLDTGFISLDELSPNKSVQEIQIKNRLRYTFQLRETEMEISVVQLRDHVIDKKDKENHYCKPFKGLIPSPKAKKKLKKS